MTERMGLVVSLPNWQPSVCQRQQWASQTCLALSASDTLTETTFLAPLFVCGRSKLSSITTVTHELSNKEVWCWAGWHSCQYPAVCYTDCVCVSVYFYSSLGCFWHLGCDIESLRVFDLFVSPSIYPSSCLSINSSVLHGNLMRWHHTSRFIDCVQTNPDLIRPHHWNACPGFTK